MAKISVVIPVYNASKTIEKCLNGIFNQTFKNLQVIAVNDGSTDNSHEILKKFGRQITIVDQPNKGASKARNVGAALATGEYVIFCDADILMKKNMIERMYNVLQRTPNASFAYSSFRFGGKKFKLWPYSKQKLFEMPYIHTTSLIRKKDFPGFDEKLKRFQDWDLWLTMASRGHIGKFIPEVLFSVKGGGTMSAWLPKILYKLPFLKKVQNYNNAKEIIKKKHNL